MRRLWEVVGIRPGEGGRAFRLFAFIFATAAAAVLAKSAQRGIFLSAYPKERIADAYLASALTLAVASLLTSAAAARLGLRRLLEVLLALAVLVFAGGWLAVQSPLPGVPLALYVAVEGVMALVLVQGWAVVSEVLDVRTAKRLLPVVGMGAGLAWTVGGFSVKWLAETVGPGGLLLGSAGLAALSLFLLELLARADWSELEKPRRRPDGGVLDEISDGLRYVATEPMTRVLAAIVAFDVLADQVLDFQLLASAQSAFATEPRAIAGFMGTYYGATGALSLIAPVVTGRILSRFGGVRALVPAAGWTVLVSAAFFAWPSLAMAAVLAGGDRVLKQSLTSPGRTQVGSSRVDLQACKLEYSIVSPK